MKQRYIYIVFSSTRNILGKAIRAVTGEPYNHLSIALDENLDQMFGFARRFYSTPLYGGFIREYRSRYFVKGVPAQIQICKLPITNTQFLILQDQLLRMYDQRDQYIYNHLSALSAIFHKNVKVENAYTCVEFGVEVLNNLNIPVNPEKYYSVCEIKQMLSDYIVYTGPMPVAAEYDQEFFAKQPLRFPTLTTIREMLKLLKRIRI